MVPCKAICFYGIQPGFFLLIKRNTHYGKVFVLISVIRGYNVRIFHAAWFTPAGPEIYQYVFATEGTEADFFTRRIWQRKIRGFLAYFNIGQIGVFSLCLWSGSG